MLQLLPSKQTNKPIASSVLFFGDDLLSFFCLIVPWCFKMSCRTETENNKTPSINSRVIVFLIDSLCSGLAERSLFRSCRKNKLYK